ncbi:MAG: proton-conducting transporter membrane subunit [Bacteroidota bacterium]
MSLTAVLLILFSFLLFALPRRVQPVFNLILTSALVFLSSYPAVNVLITNHTLIYSIPIIIWSAPLEFIIDPLSAVFILIINFTVFTGACYAITNMRMYENRSRTDFALHFFAFTWLHLSMLLVCLFHHSILFLLAWEIMSLSSFVLVIFESEKSDVLKAGINYLVQMHIGAMFLLIAFLLSYQYSGDYSWNGLSVFFAAQGNIFPFLLFFVGFGIKAGFMPLHTWLPHAHPAAPSHVSAIMSGVMIKLGIYGILRVILHLQSDQLSIGIFILLISVFTGIGGISSAIVQRDLKKLLAYSSIENIGIIGIGIGMGLIGAATGMYPLALLGYGGALLHTLNHSLFKSMLFYTAGTVYRKTHTRNSEHLGGLIKKLPHTAALFLIASLAICGLPAFNGFVSEFLIYNGFLQGLLHASFGMKILFIFCMLALVVIGGLALFCFTKVFGLTFLGTPRKIKTDDLRESSGWSLLPLYLILALIIFVGVYPAFIAPVLFQTAGIFIPAPVALPTGTIGSISSISWFVMLFVGIVILIYILKKIITRNKKTESGPTWGCGYTGPAEGVQYTSSSFSENYYFSMEKQFDMNEEYVPIPSNEIFPEKRSWVSQTGSIAEKKFFGKIIAFFLKIFRKLAFVQTGQTQHYILYMFVLLVALIFLTLFKII